MRKLSYAISIVCAALVIAKSAIALDTQKQNFIFHAYSGASLTLDEGCHLMTDGERTQIQLIWDQTKEFYGGITDVKVRMNLLSKEIALEDNVTSKTSCGPDARAIIDDTLSEWKKANH